MAYNNGNNNANGSPLNARASGTANGTGRRSLLYVPENYEAFALRERKSQKLRIVNAQEYNKVVTTLLENNAKYQRVLDLEHENTVETILKKTHAYRELLARKANAKDAKERKDIEAQISVLETKARQRSEESLKRLGAMKLKYEREAQDLALNKTQFDFQESFAKMRRYEQQNYFERERSNLDYTISQLHDQITALREKGSLTAEEQSRVLQYESELDDQLEARSNLIKGQLKLQMTVASERLREEADAYEAEIEFENKLYNAKQTNADVLAEQQHWENMQRIKKEHHEAVKFIKQEHDLKMEELELEAKTAMDKDRIQHELNMSREADTAQAIKDGQTVALNNAKLSDKTRYYSPEERKNMHNQNFEAMIANRSRMNVAHSAENKAFKELSKSTGKSIKELRQDIRNGVEFEDRDNDLVNIIKDAQSQQSILGGLFGGGGGGGFFQTIGQGLLGGNGFGGAISGALSGVFSNFLSGPVGTILHTVAGIAGKLNAKLDEYMDTYYQYQSALMTRLNGSDHKYDDMQKFVRTHLASGLWTTQSKVMEHIADLVEKGIAQNVEERALLMALGDKIVTTFDADNASLMRLIRLQQRDSTAMYMGMEGFLNKLLNQWFEDTSYLTDEFDNIESILLELDSTLSDSVGVNFAIQKWMAALSTMGMSGNTLQKLTEGLVALGTGDITTLNSNESLQSLFAIVANNKNLHYGDMLANGITEGNINTIMKGIVEYINDINTQNNNVVTAQYQQLFNMSRADFEAISNLAQSSKLSAVYGAYSTSASSMTWLDDQISTIGDRMHMSEKVDNLIENALTTVATEISDTWQTYGIWKVNEFLGGLDLPLISDVATLANSVIALGAGVKSVVSVVSQATNPFKVKLNEWENSDFETRSRGKSIPVATPSSSSGAAAGSAASAGVSSGTSSSYSLSATGGVSQISHSSTNVSSTAGGSYDSLTEQINDVANYVDDSGNTLADYRRQIDAAMGTSVSKTSLTEANSVSNTSITSAETQKESDTLSDLYNDLFTKAILVKPTDDWFTKAAAPTPVNVTVESEPVAPASASIENVSRTIIEVNKIINNSNNSLNVTVTNATLKTDTNITNINDAVKTILVSSILSALTKNAERTESKRPEKEQTGMLTMDDLIYKIINGEVNVNISNSNFDTVLSKYLMEN